MDKLPLFFTSSGITLVITVIVLYQTERLVIYSPGGRNTKAWLDREALLREEALKTIPDVRVAAVNCSKLAVGANGAKKKALQYQLEVNGVSTKTLTTHELGTLTTNCSDFLKNRRYTTTPLSKEEKDFPLGFSILVYKDPGQAERLLRAIYQPQNFYCLHVDASSPGRVLRVLKSLAACFPNVFAASKAIDVVWSDYSVLEADLTCMEDLFSRPNWKYFINLTGQEYPLKTNLELVRILKIFNGSNDISGIPLNKLQGHVRRRIEVIHVGAKKGSPKDPFPVNLTFHKGPVHIAATREFVDFVLHKPIATNLRDWSKDTKMPDESFFNTLQHNPTLGAPGAYTGPESKSERSIVRHKIWRQGFYGENAKNRSVRCHGKYIRSICIPGIEDLPTIVQSKKLFLNKLHTNYQPLVLDCLEELHFKRVKDGFLQRDNKFPEDLDYYQNLDFVKFTHQSSLP